VEVDADMVKRNWRRTRRRTTLIKSNNPHLAGGELVIGDNVCLKTNTILYQNLADEHLKSPAQA
jgi:hypothetical protein